MLEGIVRAALMAGGTPAVPEKTLSRGAEVSTKGLHVKTSD